MENIGALAILLAFCLAVYSVLCSVIGKVAKRPFLAVSAQRAVYAVFGLLTLASSLLVYLLLTGDYHIAYVAAHSDPGMPALYKFTAWWGGQEGSLLLWSWLLSGYSAVVMWTNRRRFRDMMPWVTFILMATETFFLTLITFPLSPFKILIAGAKANLVEGQPQGLNPLLQYPAMAIHPPMLYLGYVGFTVPFAFAIAALITKQPGDAWIHTTRRWTLITWLFQSTGVTLGMGWAYAVLGWGGYWGWDPVENASLLPWISGTAFLHSVMMQEKKGMMKVWNMVLVSGTFFLCILGTFLTRSGIVSSVHAFAQSTIGNYFVVFLTVGIGATIWVILDRLKYLKSEAHLESVVSRESSFLFNNLILLSSCFAVLWGTLFPVISEAITGEKISVDKPFYDKILVPVGLFLMFLTGVGPLVAWRRSSLESLRRAFLWPSVAALALVVALCFGGVYEHPYALVSFGLCLFVTVTVALEFWKGAHAIRAKSEMNLLRAAVELTHRNTRRYGGYIVHMGVVVMFIGFTGSAFNKDLTVQVTPGQDFAISHYNLTVTNMLDGDNDNYEWRTVSVAVRKAGEDLGTLRPEHRFYKSSRQPASLVAIRRRLNEDLYVNFAGMSSDNSKLVIQAYVFPLVSWIWLGYYVLLFGTLVCLVPPKVRLAYARTEVVGIVPKHESVEK
jgi:cytochrome c-type biogenesis protein CcmF